MNKRKLSIAIGILLALVFVIALIGSMLKSEDEERTGSNKEFKCGSKHGDDLSASNTKSCCIAGKHMKMKCDPSTCPRHAEKCMKGEMKCDTSMCMHQKEKCAANHKKCNPANCPHHTEKCMKGEMKCDTTMCMHHKEKCAVNEKKCDPAACPYHADKCQQKEMKCNPATCKGKCPSKAEKK